MRFTTFSILFDRFYTCTGDERDDCESCKAKFFCYTGELPTRFAVGEHGLHSENIELNALGSVRNRVLYDDVEANIGTEKRVCK